MFHPYHYNSLSAIEAERAGNSGRSRGAASNYDEITSVQSFSTGIKSSKSNNSFFDPPIENYRFYFQLSGKNHFLSEITPATGF